MDNMPKPDGNFFELLAYARGVLHGSGLGSYGFNEDSYRNAPRALEEFRKGHSEIAGRRARGMHADSGY